MNFVLRRSLPSLGGLVGLLMAVGFLAVATVGFPVWFPVVLAIVVILVQYGVNPFIIEWLVPAVVVNHDGEQPRRLWIDAAPAVRERGPALQAGRDPARETGHRR